MLALIKFNDRLFNTANAIKSPGPLNYVHLWAQLRMHKLDAQNCRKTCAHSEKGSTTHSCLLFSFCVCMCVYFFTDRKQAFDK